MAMNDWNRDTIVLGILLFLIFIVFYLIWFILSMNKMVQSGIMINTTCASQFDTTVLFPTTIYTLIISSVRTKDDILAFDKKSYSKNNWEQFVKDVRLGKINTIILAGKPYTVKFKNEDGGFVYVTTENVCHLLKLPACPGYKVSKNKNRDAYVKNIVSKDIQNLLNQVVHVLGYRI